MTNILLVCTDQHRYDVLGCYGNPTVRTPTLDALAAQGTLFERCYAPSPVCAPTRASMLTGRYPHAHGLWANGVRFPSGHPLLGRILADAGYDTGLVGRMHLAASAYGRTEPRFDDGFRFYEWADAPLHRSPDNRYHHWLQERFPELWQEQLDRAAASSPVPRGGREAPGFCSDMPTEAHYSRWVSDNAIGFLRDERDADKPFFLVANFYEPHHPYVAPKQYLAQYAERPLRTPIRPQEPADGKPELQARLSDGLASHSGGFASYPDEELQDVIAAYYAMVTHVDDEIGRLLRALDELGLADDTVVVFTSDHGEMLGDHGQLRKGPLFYEGAVHVPMVLRWPGTVPAGVRRSELVQSLDVFATCLGAAGLPADAASPSRDLVSTARGDDAGRGWALCEYRDSGYPLDPPVHATVLRTDRHKLVTYHGDGKLGGELYDLAEDPEELTNLWHQRDHDGLRLELTATLVDALVETENRSAPREAPW